MWYTFWLGVELERFIVEMALLLEICPKSLRQPRNCDKIAYVIKTVNSQSVELYAIWFKEACLDSNDLARRIVEIVEDKQASDILLLNVSEQTTIANFFVIATVDNERQANAIRDELWEQLQVKEKIRPLNSGAPVGSSGGWVLLDYGDVILHLFTEEARLYYNLEELWQEANVVLKML
jgi:ribosome-associated protein